MKQLFIASNAAVATSLSTAKAGQLYIFDLESNTALSEAPKKDFGVALSRGEDILPFMIPEIPFDNFTCVKATKTEGKTFSAKITIPSDIVPGIDYTVIFVKKGKHFNERANWTVTHRAGLSDDASSVASVIAEYVNNNPGLGLKANAEASVVTVTASSTGENFEVIATDGIGEDAVVVTQNGVPATLDKKYVQDLALQCTAGKGMNSLSEDGKEIYPYFSEEVEDTNYVMYTLRYAVGRKASKTRDEVVNQILHIVVPEGASSITTLETIFGIA